MNTQQKMQAIRDEYWDRAKVLAAKRKRKPDIEISGQGFDGHVAYSDQTGMTQDITDAAHTRGLSVVVNGRKYLGNNRAGKKVSA